jgi:CTP synthase (UTP-ammonia lyase)
MCVVLQVNPEFVSCLEEKGMRFVGRSEDGKRMEIMELSGKVCFFSLKKKIVEIKCASGVY